MCVTICGRFCPDEGVVAGYGNRIRTKYTAKWSVQIVRMIFQTHSSIVYQKWEGNSKMSKKEGKGLKSFNKGFQVPDTYIIIFLVVVVAALLTFLVPKGFYETQDISYMINGVEKTRTVIKDGSFQYLTDDAGNVVTEGVALFSGDGGTGFFNYMYNGIVNSSAIEIIAFLMVVGGAFGIMIRTGAIESGLIGLIRKAKGTEKLLIPILFVLFSLGGAVFGMGEEALPFTMILCPLFVAVGYD